MNCNGIIYTENNPFNGAHVQMLNNNSSPRFGHDKWLKCMFFDTGPAFNIFLRLCDFHLGPFVVNKYTAPGVRTKIWYTLCCFNFATHKGYNTHPPPLQLFMCLLWILLQLAVVFMYWDLLPLERGKSKESSTNQSREEEDEQQHVEEDDDEEKPLMGSQEVLGSYGSVVASNTPTYHSPAASNATLNHISPPASPVPPDSHEPSSPFKNFSISRGGCLTVRELFWGS